MEIQIKEIRIPTKLGHTLAVTKFVPTQSTNYVLVISSATGVLQKYYSRFASYVASQGALTYTFDYHGIGKSNSTTKALKENVSNAMSWGSNDQAALVAHAKKEYPHLKLILVAHSIGGQLLGFNPNYHMIDKVVLVASQTGYWKDFNGLHKIKMWLFWYIIIPVFTSVPGYFPAKKLGLFENLPKQVAYEWGTWGKHTNYLMHSYTKETHFFEKLQMPMLALSFSKDSYAPKKTVDLLLEHYKSASIVRKHYKPLDGGRHVKHFGFFKAWAQQPFWEQCLNYIVNGKYET